MTTSSEDQRATAQRQRPQRFDFMNSIRSCRKQSKFRSDSHFFFGLVNGRNTWWTRRYRKLKLFLAQYESSASIACKASSKLTAEYSSLSASYNAAAARLRCASPETNGCLNDLVISVRSLLVGMWNGCENPAPARMVSLFNIRRTRRLRKNRTERNYRRLDVARRGQSHDVSNCPSKFALSSRVLYKCRNTYCEAARATAAPAFTRPHPCLGSEILSALMQRSCAS